MSTALNKAVILNLPLDSGSNDYGAMAVNVNTTAHAVTLPTSWSGRLIALRAFTNNVVVGLSYTSGATVAAVPTATAGGTVTNTGATIVAGTLYTCVLPSFEATRQLYAICNSNTANTVLEMWAMRDSVAPVDVIP